MVREAVLLATGDPLTSTAFGMPLTFSIIDVKIHCAHGPPFKAIIFGNKFFLMSLSDPGMTI